MENFVRPAIYGVMSIADVESQLRRDKMPAPFIRRMRVINLLSALTLRKIEDNMIAPFEVMDIHHVLNEHISQDAIIAMLENKNLALALETGNLQPLWVESKEKPLLRKGFEQGWMQRFNKTPFDPICVMLAMRAKLMLDAVDELGHSYNLLRKLGMGWIDFGEIPGEEAGDPDSYIPPAIDSPIEYPDAGVEPAPPEPEYVPGPGEPGYIPPADLTPTDPGYITEPGSPGYIPPADLTPTDPGYITEPGSPGYIPPGEIVPGEPGYVPPGEPAIPEPIPSEPAIPEVGPEVQALPDILPEGLAAPLHVDSWSLPQSHALRKAAEQFYFYEMFNTFTDNPWSKYTTGSASIGVVGGTLELDNAYVGTACRAWCNLTVASPEAWLANFRAKVTRPMGDSPLIVTFYMDNGYAQLWLWNTGRLYMMDSDGNTNYIDDIVPLNVFLGWQVYSTGDYYWVYKNSVLIGGPIRLRSPSGRQVKLEQSSEGYSKIDEVIITHE